MRTSTNFFLFSLAVADIAILLMGETIIVSSQLPPKLPPKRGQFSTLPLKLVKTIGGGKKDDGALWGEAIIFSWL